MRIDGVALVPQCLNLCHSIMDKKNFFQIWVYGNNFESLLMAVVVPQRKAIADWSLVHNVSDDFKSLCDNLKARKYILDELNNTGQKHQVCIQ